jgi:hypothetical protein
MGGVYDSTRMDEDKLFNAIVYFCFHNLKHINPQDLPEIYIGIDTAT